MSKIEPLLRKSQVAEILQVDERTVDRYRDDGILQACNLPTVRFEPNHIRELIGVKLEKFSPLERRRLEGELEYWKTKAEKLEEVFNKVDMAITETKYLRQKET